MNYKLKVWYAATPEDDPQVQLLAGEGFDRHVRSEVGVIHAMRSLDGPRRVEIETVPTVLDSVVRAHRDYCRSVSGLPWKRLSDGEYEAIINGVK